MCLLLANCLIGMIILAYQRVTLTSYPLLDVTQQLGDRVLGGALLLGALAAALTAVLRREDLARAGGSSSHGKLLEQDLSATPRTPGSRW